MYITLGEKFSEHQPAMSGKSKGLVQCTGGGTDIVGVSGIVAAGGCIARSQITIKQQSGEKELVKNI